MADDFDPYYQWLGIPAKHQPPHHYRLLGVELFEVNPDVISMAADQRMAHVRSFQTGKRSPQSQKILNELSTARRCLLNAKTKAEYDAQLQASLAAESPAAAGAKPTDERWTKDLAADVKAASRFATCQAERLKIASLKLPAAYAALGNDIYNDGLLKEDFAGLYALLAAAGDQLEQTKDGSRKADWPRRWFRACSWTPLSASSTLCSANWAKPCTSSMREPGPRGRCCRRFRSSKPDSANSTRSSAPSSNPAQAG